MAVASLDVGVHGFLFMLFHVEPADKQAEEAVAIENLCVVFIIFVSFHPTYIFFRFHFPHSSLFIFSRPLLLSVLSDKYTHPVPSSILYISVLHHSVIKSSPPPPHRHPCCTLPCFPSLPKPSGLYFSPLQSHATISLVRRSSLCVC